MVAFPSQRTVAMITFLHSKNQLSNIISTLKIWPVIFFSITFFLNFNNMVTNSVNIFGIDVRSYLDQQRALTYYFVSVTEIFLLLFYIYSQIYVTLLLRYPSEELGYAYFWGGGKATPQQCSGLIPGFVLWNHSCEVWAPYEVPGIESKLGMCKASTLPRCSVAPPPLRLPFFFFFLAPVVPTSDP